MKVLNIQQLSYWERTTYFEDVDFLIVGAGIVGYSAAIALKQKYPNSKILIIERGYLPSGASTKNAGFACFGSPSELLDDLNRIDIQMVWETVSERWHGLQYLKSLIGEQYLEFEQHGSWDLIMFQEEQTEQHILEKLIYLNEEIEKITGFKDVFREDKNSMNRFGFKGIKTAFYNRLEGQVNTGKMLTRMHQMATEKGVLTLFGINVDAFQLNLYNIGIQSSVGFFKVKNVLICTNGFAHQFFPTIDIQPARAQVLVTSPIENLKIKGTFHFQQGYYYFRDLKDRILIGGGRNIDFKGETTTKMETTVQITHELKCILQDVILPNQNFSIEYEWAGIMGVGLSKKPIIEKIDDKIAIGARMGGMGVAIGAMVGKKLADLF